MQRVLPYLLTACLFVTGLRASAQSSVELKLLNPSLTGEVVVPDLDMDVELHNMSFERSEKDAYLNLSLPFAFGKRAHTRNASAYNGPYMYGGLVATNTNFNIENFFSAELRYGLRFNFSNSYRKLYFTTALSAGVEYYHIDIDKLLENGSDPYLNTLAPNEVTFAGQVGVALHNDHFSVSLFTPRFAQRLAQTPIALSAAYATDKQKPVAFEMSAYGLYTFAGKEENYAYGAYAPGLYGKFYASLLLVRVLGIDADFDSRLNMHVGASLHIKKAFSVRYSVGIPNLSPKRGGQTFLSHRIGLYMAFGKRERDDNYLRERD